MPNLRCREVAGNLPDAVCIGSEQEAVMSMDFMLNTIREHGTRRQYRDACTYAAHGRRDAIGGIYRRIVGNV